MKEKSPLEGARGVAAAGDPGYLVVLEEGGASRVLPFSRRVRKGAPEPFTRAA